MNGHQYKVSVIMAVYNVELFLREAIDSVIEQDIGFENIQLILVDDGTPDGSGAICDEYAEKYPDNIVVIHKENGGVSSARNVGVKHACGQYLNFMDADDKLSANVCRNVVEFFDKNYDDVDVVAFPMYFFDGQKGAHILNNKFKKGSRLIDLRKEYQFIQLSTASSFLKRSAFQELDLAYDERLKYTEDAKLLVQLLCEKKRLGVVSNCEYYVRRRSAGAMSATQQSASRKEWWLETLEYFQAEIISYCLEHFGNVPKYVQYLMAYDLQWRLQQQHFHASMTDEEIDRFYEKLHYVASHIGDDIFWEQKNIWREHKTYALRKKYAAAPEVVVTHENLQLYYGEKEVFSLADNGLTLSFLSIHKDVCEIDGFLMHPIPVPEDIRVEVTLDSGDVFSSVPIAAPAPTTILDEVEQMAYAFRVRIPLDMLQEYLTASFYVCFGNSRVLCRNLRLGKYFPIAQNLGRSYYYKDRYKVSMSNQKLVIRGCGPVRHLVSEAKFLYQLFKKKPAGGQKAIIARILYHICLLFKKKPLILISDRIMRGGDNGEAMFRYIQQYHSKDVMAYFVVSKQSEDFKRLGKIGRVVDSQSYKHKLLHLLCDYNISSSAEIQTVNPFAGYDSGYRDLLNGGRYVFLQHGITKDDISGWINRYDKRIHGIVAAANNEANAFMAGQYGFAEENVWLTGFPRFDRLYNESRKCIAVVPTWRKHLMGKLDPQTGLWGVSPDFKDSDFVMFYHNLLNDPRLLRAAREFNYTIQFFPHPNLQGLVSEFDISSEVEVLGSDTQYRDLYAHTNLIVTDFSSAVFDFAYLRKPVVYCQFDADTFFDGGHSYQKGYFDYERDGFGEVEYTLEGTVDRLIEYMANDCQMKDEYRKRVDDFFAFDDQNNAKRVYEKMMNVER